METLNLGCGAGAPPDDLPALEDPRWREQMQGLKDLTAALNGEESSPVRFSTDATSSRANTEVRDRATNDCGFGVRSCQHS